MVNKLNEIEQSILKNLVCPLRDEAKNLVFGKGNETAQIFIIAEAPGKKEDETGLPFMGASGKRLDGFLTHIELTLDDVYIANILKYRPPKNRDPTIEEMHNHTPYLLQQILAVDPLVILPLGKFATQFVLAGFKVDKAAFKLQPKISELHGTSHKVIVGKKTYTVIPLYHPAATIYNQKLRPIMKEDLEKVKKIIET